MKLLSVVSTSGIIFLILCDIILAKIGNRIATRVNRIFSPNKSLSPLVAICVTMNPIAFNLLVPPMTANAVDITADCTTDSNPSTTVITCRKLGITKDNRLLGCQANENCFSTSASAATKYASPWIYNIEKPDDAMEVLKIAAEEEGLKILQFNLNNRYMLAAEKGGSKQPAGSSLFYEFLLRPDDHLVLYRGVVDKTIFVYPLQQPDSDFGVLLKRLDNIRIKTGWSKVMETSAAYDNSNALQDFMDR